MLKATLVLHQMQRMSLKYRLLVKPQKNLGPKPDQPKIHKKLGPKMVRPQNPIVFEETHFCEGLWKKIIQRRSNGNHLDSYLYSPSGKKLRSANELFEYITKHPKYWATFDPNTINFAKTKNTKMSMALRNLSKFLQMVRNGFSKEEAIGSCQQIPRKSSLGQNLENNKDQSTSENKAKEDKLGYQKITISQPEKPSKKRNRDHLTIINSENDLFLIFSSFVKL